jgi:hypothetical protein
VSLFFLLNLGVLLITNQGCSTERIHSNYDRPVNQILADIAPEVNEFVLPLEGFNIKAGKKEKNLVGHAGLYHNAGQVPTFPVSVEWSNMQAEFAPANNAAVRVDYQ